ncbi:MAG: hypothetical protein AB1755_00250 [Candidatus Omnitrophota bacterium]
MKNIKNNFIIAICLYLIDVFILNQGIIAIFVIFIIIFFLFPRLLFTIFKKDKMITQERAIILLIYILMVIGIITSNKLNNKIAFMRAKKIIQACEEYKSKYQTYPNKLYDLVPEFITKIPVAKLTLQFNKFYYISSNNMHAIYFVSRPPFGRPIYNLEKGSWGYLD